MALPATDTFSGTTGQDLTAYSASWSSAFSTAGNQLECDGSGNARAALTGVEAGNFWNADSFDNDQYAEITADFTDNNNPVGVLVRATAGGNGYGCYAGGSTLWIFELNSNVWTALGATVSVGLTSGDHTIRLEVQGITLTVFVDGVSVATRTDATHASGAAGVSGFTASAPGTALIRSWEGGDLAFAKVEGVAESSVNTAGTSHTVTLPASIDAADLVLILMDIGSTSATLNSLTDWGEVLDESAANGLKILRYTGAGVPGNPTFTSSASTRSASIAYRISGADKTITPQIGTTATGTSTTPNPPSVTPTGGTVKDHLFIAFFGSAGEEVDDDTWCNTPPTGYLPSPPRQKSCGTAGSSLGGLIASAERSLTTGAAQDPGTFSIDVSAAWRAQTIIIHPGSATVDDTATPAVTANTVTFPAATVQTGWTVNPAVTALTSTYPAAAAGAAATAQPAPLAVVATCPAVTIKTGWTATPAAKVAVATFPASTAKAGWTSSPAVHPATATFPAVTARAGWTVTPDPLATVLTFPLVAVSAGGGASVSPGAVVLTVSFPAVTASGVQNATVTPAAHLTVAALPAVVARTGWTAVPGVHGTLISFPAVLAGAAATVAPAVKTLLMTFPAVTRQAGSSSSPSPLAVVAFLPPVTARSGWTPAPAPLGIVLVFPAIFIVPALDPAVFLLPPEAVSVVARVVLGRDRGAVTGRDRQPAAGGVPVVTTGRDGRIVEGMDP